jgi:hypothetical protein
VRLTFSKLRFKAAWASVSTPFPRGSQACKSARVTVARVSRFLARLDGKEKPTVRCLAIPTCDLMNNLDRILVPTFAHEKLWRLKYREDDEAQEEFNHTDSTHNDNEVSPTHILRMSTHGVLLTSEITKYGPGNQGSNDLGEGPINRQDRQEILMRTWKKLEKNGRIHGQVAANAKAPESCKAANGSKVRRTGSDESKDASDTQRKVEGPFTAKDVAAKAPEHGASEKTNVLGECQKGRPSRFKFVGDWCNYDNPPTS